MANNEKTPVQIPEWADNGAITTPTASQVQAGWIQGQRPFHFTMNWIQNIYAQKINYILARGVADWVASNPYEQYALINYEGVIYRKKSAGTTTSSTTPDADTTNWERNTPVFDVNPTPNTGMLRGSSGEGNVNGLNSTDDVTIDGDVSADNLSEDLWKPTRRYKFGQKAITRGIRGDGEEYSIVWVNVKKGGDNVGIDPEGTDGSNLKNTTYITTVPQKTEAYDWFNDNWRQERAEIYISGLTTQENHFVSILGYITPKGTMIEGKGNMTDSVISTPPSPTYIEFKNLTDQYGYSLSDVLIGGDSVFSTNTLIQNQTDRDADWNIEPVHYGTLPALFWVWADNSIDNKKAFAFANNLTDTTAGARAKFIMQEFYITNKIRAL